jgi:hypothetical protein
MRFNLKARMTAEFVGTAFLLASVVGSGIMGERLAGGNVAMALLANTIATGAALVALILSLRLSVRCSLQSCGYSGGCVPAWHSVERGAGVLNRPDRGGLCRSRLRSSDVWTATLFGVTARPQRSPAGFQRVRSDFWSTLGYLGLFAVALVRCAVCGRCLYHSRVLVHRIDIICESCGRSG